MQQVQTIKRDFNLIRKIMLQIGTSFTPGQPFQLPPYPVNDPTVNLHILFLKEENMVQAHCDKNQITGQVPVAWIVDILSDGYDFLALIQDENNWNTVMNNFSASHKEPTFDTLIHALKHIEETQYLTEQRELVAKQDKYTVTIRKATVSSMVATWVMAIAIIVQIVLPLSCPSRATSPAEAQPKVKVEIEVPQVIQRQDSIKQKDSVSTPRHIRRDSIHIHPARRKSK
jgi:hypothetical protein